MLPTPAAIARLRPLGGQAMTGVVGLAVRATTTGGDAFDPAAIPYHAWANRSVEAMRVWIPRADLPDDAPRPRS